MTGAEAVLRTLVASGVEVAFANPGTSEMHLVAALDEVPEFRGVLTLFEGVATGAADGYGRLADRPAATLLHLGPGLANGLANLHNARRARTPIVNLVGDHATIHGRFDPPLESDIQSLALPVSSWFRRSAVPDQAGPDTADAVAAARRPPGGVATLVLPADVSWSEAPGPAAAVPVRLPSQVPESGVEAIAKVLRSGQPAALLLGGPALREPALQAAARCAAASGARFLAETFPARMRHGAGVPAPERLAYFAEMAEPQLAGLEHLVLVGCPPPVAFFAYPGRPSSLVPPGCQVHTLAEPEDDVTRALGGLAEALGAPEHGLAGPAAGRPDRPTGALTAETVAAAVGSLLPEEAVVVDEANTSGIFLPGATAGAPPHDWLTLTGGAIGQGLPAATGAAVAAPDRRILALEADGSALYTIQSLWTQAREGLPVTTVILANRSYAILRYELARVGARTESPAALAMLDLSRPEIDFAALARGMGVPAWRVDRAEDLVERLDEALVEEGPALIEAVLS